jgi:4-hydroxy-tetrahydrodipicolinate reductase
MEQILISGIHGKIGEKIKQHLLCDYTILGHCKPQSLSLRIQETNPDLIIDVTSALTIHEHLATYNKFEIPTIIGTSGLSPTEAHLIAKKSAFPLLIVPNFSLSFQQFFQSAVLLSQQHPVLKIIETHHKTKVDTPSGSSLYLAHALQHPPIQSQRINAYIAKHEVVFDSDGISLSHVIQSPDAFMSGVVAAISHISNTQRGEVMLSFSAK